MGRGRRGERNAGSPRQVENAGLLGATKPPSFIFGSFVLSFPFFILKKKIVFLFTSKRTNDSILFIVYGEPRLRRLKTKETGRRNEETGTQPN